jgi:hypothetical protein
MRNFGIALLLLAILLLLWPLNSFAQGVAFDDATAGQIVVALEKAKITEQQLSLEAESNAELREQVDILKGTIKLMEDQIVVYRNLAEMNKQMSEAKDKACQEAIKAAKPTFWENAQKYLVGIGIGGILAGVAILIL